MKGKKKGDMCKLEMQSCWATFQWPFWPQSHRQRLKHGAFFHGSTPLKKETFSNENEKQWKKEIKKGKDSVAVTKLAHVKNLNYQTHL